MTRPTFLLLYATRHGQAKKIAERLAQMLTTDDVASEVKNAGDVPDDFDLSRYRAAILVASVRIGKHEPEMIAFVKRHREALMAMPSVFVSVSMSEATIEDSHRPQKARQQATANVRKAFDDFVAATRWQPGQLLPVAGALRYTQYNFFIRFIMRMIARSTGAATDTSRDYEYTDWAALDRFAANFAHQLAPPITAENR